MLTFKVKVLFTQDEKRELPIKDKNGVPTQLMKSYRFLTIQCMYKDAALKCERPVVVKSVDPTFKVPADGSEWETPEVRRYEIENGVPVIQV